MKLLKLIEAYETLSIVGMEKNVGKTTVLNSILENTCGKTLGLTSIGRDGEERDRVTSTHKPKIWVEKNTLLATAKGALLACDITREILETTGISTPMGEVIIARALSSGYVDLAGPSTSFQISLVKDRMLHYGAKQVLVDGALGRVGTISMGDNSAAILSTGAAVSPDISEVVRKTAHRISLLQTERVEDSVFNRYLKHRDSTIVYIGENVRTLFLDSALQADKLIVDNLTKEDSHLFIKGAVVPALIERLIKNRHRFENLCIVALDGTKVFIDSVLIRKANLCRIDFRVCNEINLVGISYNPTSPYGYDFDSEKFEEELKKVTKLPVIDVLGG